MRALVAVISVLLAVEALAGENHFVSPNGEFEAYTKIGASEGYGMKLFVRRAHARDTGALLAQNNRWIDARWSPDSRFLAVIDHPDGHIADVYVFGVTVAGAAAPTATLFYHTPNPLTYNVQWDVVDWLLSTRNIILKKNVHFGFRQETMVAHIGTTALKGRRPN
jgi:hypothetical protein